MDFRQARRLIQTLESGELASAYRLSVDYGFLDQERAAYIRALASDELGGADWEAEALLRDLARLSGYEPAARQRSSKRGQAVPSRSRQSQPHYQHDPMDDESLRSAMWHGVLKGVVRSLLLLSVAGGFAWFLTRPKPPEPEIEVVKKKARKRPPTPNILERQTTPPKERATTSIELQTDKRTPLDAYADLMPAFEELVDKARAMVAVGQLHSALRILQEFGAAHPDAFWQRTVRVQQDLLRDFMKEEFAELEKSFQGALQTNQLFTARAILDNARAFTTPDGMEALVKRYNQMRQQLKTATPSSDKQAPLHTGHVSKAFFGGARTLSPQRIEIKYDFSSDEHMYDWWALGLRGRVADGALILGEEDTPWPGSTWLMHKGEFAEIHAVEYEVRVLQMNITRKPHIGWGAHLAPVPDGPWDTDVIEQGAIGWVHPKGISFWTQDREWVSKKFKRPMLAGGKYKMAVAFNGGMAEWSINGEVCRRAPMPLSGRGPRLCLMFGGGTFIIDNIRIEAAPNPNWLKAESARAEEMRQSLAEVQTELKTGQMVDLIKNGRLRGFCYNPRQFCLDCAGETGPHEMCMKEALGPFVPAWLPHKTKNGSISMQLKPVGPKGGRQWYLSFLEGGLHGYSIPLLMEKTFLGLSKIRKDRVPATLENLEESHAVFFGSDEYSGLSVEYVSGSINIKHNGASLLESVEEWDSDGYISLGGFDWSGAGHYHVRDLRVKLLSDARPPGELPVAE
ncbi:MAG: hypothetical protein QF473_10640 [Planctomycetota bacterium]|nr:hypothetical protein [Planctomycetota bacterium]